MISGTKLIYRVLLFSLTHVLLLSSQHLYAEASFKTVLYSQSKAPGVEPGVTSTDYERIAINSNGTAIIIGRLEGTGISDQNNRVVWQYDGINLNLIARIGDQAPDLPSGVHFYNEGVYPYGFYHSAINNVGQILIGSQIEGPTLDEYDNFGLWSGQAGALGLVTRTLDAAVGTGGLFHEFNKSAINDSGQITFLAKIGDYDTDPKNNYGIWQTSSTSVNLVRRSGDAILVPELPAIANLFFKPIDLTMNTSGQVAFFGTLEGSGINSDQNSGIWSNGTGSMRVLALEGAHAPGTISGETFKSYSIPKISKSGDTVFWGHLTDTDGDSSNDTGVWADLNGVVTLVARDGDHAPGMLPNILFDHIYDMSINIDGSVLLATNLTGPTIEEDLQTALWIYRDGTLELVLRASDNTPGLGTGIAFGPIQSPLLHDNGMITFYSSPIDTGVNESSPQSHWIIAPDGTTSLLSQVGESFDVDNDPFNENLKTVSSFHGTTISEAGHIYLHLSFTDGTSGIFTANLGLPGDINDDGFVGVDDLNIILTHWNQSVTPGDLLSGDANNDGYVGVDDLNKILINWNSGTPPTLAGANIPEPGAAALLGICLASTMLGRQKGPPARTLLGC